ncbi:hypothetical protein [Sphingomonas hylomeconis]|uniref:Uncharacterized protein n=1 Tax=Sphingomonas hylomeconis TaxID=1395958 RepID=A0ABV7SUY6_9SPHN|nr:hypothetical protein [Sphingomonas hylomeconis]
MLFNLGKPEPVTHELIPARGKAPAVKVTFNAQPSALSLRAARRAVAEIMREHGDDGMERAGDAFSAALIRHNILSWEGIGSAASDDDLPIAPTHDRELRDEEGNVTGVEVGTISAFLAEPRLFEAADREYVMPWTQLDAEKNGLAPSLNGTSEGETPEADTAISSATLESSGAVMTKKPALRHARTTGTKPARKRAKASGK